MAFSPSPPPNRTGYLSHHPALQFPCLFDFGLVKLALVSDKVQERVGSPHLAYLDVLSMRNLLPFAGGLFDSSVPVWTAFPSADYYGSSVTIGLAPRRPSRASLTAYESMG